MPKNLEAEVLQSQQLSSPVQSKTGSSVHEDGGNCCNKPVKDEMLDMKLKLKQMELDVLKLRSKQAQINNVKQGAPLSADAQARNNTKLRPLPTPLAPTGHRALFIHSLDGIRQ
ncbi:hypothetical protein GUJ93_ZPchr0015g6632 [Zizania palustris]|uniref:Uncharacterized protein n=1 Tax=Zizania palustris TaxID=103762 RepID=A0A8J5TGF6_ZIZPA|nr:hypothetical protein GUJ93_ZPchr0015g6632 [Zizania palustris]